MDWKIDRIREACAKCGRPFVHDQPVVSAIDFDAEDRVVRHDLCAACKPASASEVVWWETRFQLLAQRKKKVDFDRLLRIFEAWQRSPPKAATADAAAGNDHGALLYLVTLLLVRKRFLRMVDLVSEDGREFLRLRKPGATEQWYLTPAPLLTPADLPPLRARLEELIDGSFEEEEMPASPDAAAASA
jgi:hypothetical protein